MGGSAAPRRSHRLPSLTLQTFSHDHREMIARVQAMRAELEAWRDSATGQTARYSDQLEGLQEELLSSMKALQADVAAMRSRVRGVLQECDNREAAATAGRSGLGEQ